MKKFGVAERLEIWVFPFQNAFRADEFARHMTHHTYQLFASNGGIKEKIFVAVTAFDPQTRRAPMALSVISPLWHSASVELIEADVREYLARCRGLIVGAAYERDDHVFVDVEMKGRRWRTFSAEIVRDQDGVRQMSPFASVRSALRVGLPLLPADPEELS